ncbi:MAG: DegV family protein [Erysipelotrichaceae bacterium]|nr:DegV family protein [Erysipelotrichaceae bacterium]
MNFRIISDSSCDIKEYPGVDFRIVPLKILTAGKEFVDDETMDIEEMLKTVRESNEKTGSSCPSIGDWMQHFDENDGIFLVTITSGLSGSYSSALQARDAYLEEHPNAHIAVFDSQQTGPGMLLIIERISEDIQKGMSFEEIEADVRAYQKNTYLLFTLHSVEHLAKNGRLNPLVAKGIGILGIRIIAEAKEGVIHPLHNCRSFRKEVSILFDEMVRKHYHGGKVRIAHCHNDGVATALKQMLLDAFPQADVLISTLGGLCSFYAQEEGVIIGCEI